MKTNSDYAKDLAVTTAYLMTEIIEDPNFLRDIDKTVQIAADFIKRFPTDTDWEKQENTWEEELHTFYNFYQPEIFLCETEDFEYYRIGDDEVIMYRKADRKRFGVSAVNEGELYGDVRDGKITKVAPDFLYSYREMLREIKENEDLDFDLHFNG